MQHTVLVFLARSNKNYYFVIEKTFIFAILQEKLFSL